MPTGVAAYSPSSALAARAHASSPLMWSAIALTILHGSALGRLSCTSECQVERLRWAVRSCITPKISACLPSARLAAVRCCGVQRQGRPPGISICDALPDAHTFGAVYAASPWRHNEAAPRTLMQRGGVQEWLSTAEGECAARRAASGSLQWTRRRLVRGASPAAALTTSLSWTSDSCDAASRRVCDHARRS